MLCFGERKRILVTAVFFSFLYFPLFLWNFVYTYPLSITDLSLHFWNLNRAFPLECMSLFACSLLRTPIQSVNTSRYLIWVCACSLRRLGFVDLDIGHKSYSSYLMVRLLHCPLIFHFLLLKLSFNMIFL